jgi:hypothetical protein
MLDPSTVAATIHRPRVLVSRMSPGAEETAGATPRSSHRAGAAAQPAVRARRPAVLL